MDFTDEILRMLFTIDVSARMGSSSAMEAFMGCRYPRRICPQKLNTLPLTVSWKPFTKESVMIITATLITVAVMDSRIINLEKDFCWLKAIRLAMKAEMFTLMKILFNKQTDAGKITS
jgi:hypothetical protein